MIDAQLAAIRWRNLNALYEEFIANEFGRGTSGYGAAHRFAASIGVRPNVFSMLLGQTRRIGDRLAREIERRFEKPKRWLDCSSDDERDALERAVQAWRMTDDSGRSRLIDLVERLLREAQERGAFDR